MTRDFNPDLTFSCAQHVSVILERKEEGFYFSYLLVTFPWNSWLQNQLLSITSTEFKAKSSYDWLNIWIGQMFS